MVRLVFTVLLLANIGFFAWSQGFLRAWGIGPVQQSEPQRLAQQVRPELLTLLPAGEAAAGAGPRGAECLAAGPLDDATAASVRRALEGWPAGSWSLDAAVEPPRWIVYMGKYPSPEAVERKKAELRQRAITFEPLSNPALEPGLSLGGFASEAQAHQHLEALTQRGVRTASVAQERAEARGVALRLPAVDDALRARIDPLRQALGKQALRSCR
ncbi:MAG TPA: SPOR domain-containing protein [Ramlibacter sp.]|nr:SPOR domain-containing protein [Ramlibacter sp.]